jgi:hypothetical protein
MLKLARALSIAVAGFVVFALVMDAVIGLRQPSFDQGPAEGILRTVDAEGEVQETRLAVIDDGDTVWVQSAHHFRGWYHRLVENPEVELERAGKVTAYRAVLSVIKTHPQRSSTSQCS